MSFFKGALNILNGITTGVVNVTKSVIKSVSNLLFGPPAITNITNLIDVIKNTGETGKVIKLSPTISVEDIIRNVENRRHMMPVLKIGEKYYALTKGNRQRLLANYNTNESELFGDAFEEMGFDESDRQFLVTARNLPNNFSVTLYYRDVRNKKKREGAFFPYNHNMDFDLTRYQIFNEYDNNQYKMGYTENPLYHTDNCFIHSLKMWNKLNNDEIEIIKGFCKSAFIPACRFKDIVDKVDFGIILHCLKKDGQKRIIRYNENADRLIDIGKIKDHYFIIEDVKITSFAIKHYDDIKDLKKWNQIYRQDYGITNIQFISSYNVIKHLVKCEEKRLIPLTTNDELMKTPYYSKIKNEIKNLEYTKLNYKPIEYDDKTIDQYGKKRDEYADIVYWDTETTTEGNHKTYLTSSIGNDNKKNSFSGDRHIIKFLKTLKDNSLIIVQHLGYDIRHIFSYVIDIRHIQKNNSTFIFLKCKFINHDIGKKVNLTFHCSYAMIGKGLKAFPKVFELENIQKDIMPYKLYTEESVIKEKMLISEGLKNIKTSDHKEFIENIINWNLKDGEHFDHMEYSRIYCEQDVNITKLGYEKFRQWIKEITNLDIVNYLTLASVGDAYLRKEGCYDGCYSLSGIPRLFIQKCVVGGRTMVSKNEKSVFLGDADIKMTGTGEMKYLADFDGVSLYPSAMARMPGFLKGLPKVIKDLRYAFLKNQSGYFVEVDIKKVNKRRSFPLLNKKNKEGIRDYNNDITGIIYLDKTGLEDLIKFQDIEFDIVRGYYFDEGHNNKINKVIKHLFNERLKKKKENNAIEETYKLLMNACYGKSCLKEIVQDRKIIRGTDWKSYLVNNYNYIISWAKVFNSDKVIVKSINPINDHFNYCHIGCEILSMSKRIMNEVMCLAEDLGINIYYQDTDSMHIESDKINELALRYSKVYKRNLIGKNLGQFHSDFDYESDEEVLAVESIFLGKKSYIDKVRIVKDGKTSYDYHIRMKGIPSDVLLQKVKTCFDNDPIKLYKYLLAGKEVKFDLLDNGTIHGVTSFKSNDDYTINTRLNDGTYCREVVFLNKEEKKQFIKEKKRLSKERKNK